MKNKTLFTLADVPTGPFAEKNEVKWFYEDIKEVVRVDLADLI